MRPRRFLVIVVIAGGFATVSLLVGLITNVASSQSRWPGALHLLQTHPWRAFGIFAFIMIGLAIALAVLSDPDTPPAPTNRTPPTTDDPPAPDAVTVMRSLPRDTSAFTNRDVWLRHLVDLVDANGDTGVLPVHAVDGMPGIGKTAFAIHIGHVLASRFPDGQLFVNLNGHTADRRPVSPSDALASLLTADGVPPQRIPIGTDAWTVTEARAALWRSRLADRRMLVILDNAADYAQVEPLLPGAGRCLVMVTSRRRLAELEGVTMAIDALDPPDAAALLIRLSGRETSTMAAAVVDDLTALCGYLPLAISLLAAQLRHHPGRSATAMADRLRDARDRPGALRAGDRAVAAAFDLSYLDLPPERQRFFRYLGWFPGVGMAAFQAAALADIDVRQAAEYLDLLYDDHLLEESGDGRYHLHDLLRDYSRTLAAADQPQERGAAMTRLTEFYLAAITAANGLVARPGLISSTSPGAGVTVPALQSREQAVAWLEQERATILALIEETSATGRIEDVIGLSAAMRPFLRQAGPWDQAVQIHLNAAALADRAGDLAGRAEALAETGVVLRLTGDYPAATGALTQAIELFVRMGRQDSAGHAHALNQLGIVRYMMADYPAAADDQSTALRIFTDLGDRLGQANALADLGMVRRQTSRYAEAETAQTAALELYRQLGDAYGQANVLRDLGIVHTVHGDYPRAAERHTAALAIYQRLEDRAHQGYALNELGAVRRLQGDLQAASAAHLRALDLYVELGERFGQATSLRHLGTLRRLTDDYPGALTAQTEALTRYRESGSRGGEAASLGEIGVLRARTGDTSGAREAFAQAVASFRDLGERWGQAEVTNHWGTLLSATDPEAAAARFAEARTIAQEIDCPLEEARAQAGIGALRLARGDRPGAAAALRQALTIFQRIEVPEATGTAALLAACIEDDHR